MRGAAWKRCTAEPGPYQAQVFVTVPALRSGMKLPRRVRDTSKIIPQTRLLSGRRPPI